MPTDAIANIWVTPVLRDLIVAGFSMIGIYLVSGIAYLDPWHCLTSFVQYTFFFMSFPNILNVYACKICYSYCLVCNLHDVSWGTKGDNGAESLGGVRAVNKNGKSVVSVALPMDESDIDLNYDSFHKDLNVPDKENPTINEKTLQEDYFRSFRTYTVLSWFFSNAIVIVALTNQSIYAVIFNQSLPVNKGGEFNPYLRFLFYFVALISFVRLSGSLLYLILWYGKQSFRNLKYYISN
jgi:chitin synthase